MAGRDQSANLGGMLSQIGQTIGSRSKAYDPVMEAAKPRLPNLDPSDPESIQRYVDAVKARGEMTPGSELQFAYMLREAQNNKRRADADRDVQGLISGLRGGEKALGQLRANRETALASGNDKAVEQLDLRIAEGEESVRLIEEQIDANPAASEALFKIERKEQERAVMQEAAELRALRAQQRAEQEQFDTASNNYTAAIIAGDLPTDAPVLQQLKATRPDIYESVVTRATKLVEDERALRDGLDPADELSEEYFEGFPEGTYERYLEAHVISPKSANTNAISGRRSIDVAKAKAGDDKADEGFKYTDGIRDDAERTARLILRGLATGQAKGENWLGKEVDSEFTRKLNKLFRKHNTPQIKEMTSYVVGVLERNGKEPTEENIMMVLPKALEIAGFDLSDVDMEVNGLEFDFGDEGEAADTPASTEPAETEAKKSADDYL